FPGPPEADVPGMIAERLRPAPVVRPANPAVSPAAEAIVRRCLEPDPARRYQSAQDLREDIDRHLAHQPLRHTPEPSAAERLRKGARRHPRLASCRTVTVLAVAVVVGLGAALFARSHRLAGLEAEAQLRAFRSELHEARLLLAAGPEDGSLR